MGTLYGPEKRLSDQLAGASAISSKSVKCGYRIVWEPLALCRFQAYLEPIV